MNGSPVQNSPEQNSPEQNSTVQIVVQKDGTALCIYCEQIDLTSLGQVRVDRASHVEPDELGQWWADLSPMSGPTLGPFQRRSAALAAETLWLETHMLSRC